MKHNTSYLACFIWIMLGMISRPSPPHLCMYIMQPAPDVKAALVKTPGGSHRAHGRGHAHAHRQVVGTYAHAHAHARAQSGAGFTPRGHEPTPVRRAPTPALSQLMAQPENITGSPQLDKAPDCRTGIDNFMHGQPCLSPTAGRFSCNGRGWPSRQR